MQTLATNPWNLSDLCLFIMINNHLDLITFNVIVFLLKYFTAKHPPIYNVPFTWTLCNILSKQMDSAEVDHAAVVAFSVNISTVFDSSLVNVMKIISLWNFFTATFQVHRYHEYHIHTIKKHQYHNNISLFHILRSKIVRENKN